MEFGLRSQFSSEDPEFADILWSRIRDTLPSELDGGQAFGLMPSIVHAKCWAGQEGFAHMDFRQSLGGHASGGSLASRVSLTVYLHEDYEGESCLQGWILW
mmetsp:Transcript_158460/g.508316  ORF Transcript_158460/g.508316 Transcript_158460/m.508316 type:complete len:101 (-) Transcript_158460:68-370(-)